MTIQLIAIHLIHKTHLLKVVLQMEIHRLKAKIKTLFSKRKIKTRIKESLLKHKWLETLKFMKRKKKVKDKLGIPVSKMIKNRTVNLIRTKIKK